MPAEEGKRTTGNVTRPGAARTRPLPLLITLLACCAGCSAVLPGWRPQPLATSLHEIVPHGHRDHFVFLWERLLDGRRVSAGIQVEHVSMLEADRVYEVLLSEDGRASGRLRILDEDNRLSLLAEDDLTHGLRYVYLPPLLQVEVPLVPGDDHRRALVEVTRLEDNEHVGSFAVTQSVHVGRAPAGHTRLGPHEGGVAVDVLRTIDFPDAPLQVRSSMVLVPGIGEVQSEGTLPGEPVLRRELACAIIGGRSLGSCEDLLKWLQEMDDAGPTDIR